MAGGLPSAAVPADSAAQPLRGRQRRGGGGGGGRGAGGGGGGGGDSNPGHTAAQEGKYAATLSVCFFFKDILVSFLKLNFETIALKERYSFIYLTITSRYI